MALVPELANAEHYEVPPAFFQLFLGRWRKYSCGYWNENTRTLDDAEEAMLERTCRRAGLEDGMDILDLGCGWGSLTLWMARQYPGSRILAVSNSAPQRRFIETECRRQGLHHVQVVTADMNDFAPGRSFHRVVSLEMFEHMRNHRLLLSRIASWLQPGGRLFMHIFCHRRWTYFFETGDRGDWMARHFFTGGLMPAVDLPDRFTSTMSVVQKWTVNGVHYQKTLEAWLHNLDRRRQQALAVLKDVYPQGESGLWLQRWRMFMMACSELFGYNQGHEWLVGHYLMEPPANGRSREA